MSDLKAICKDCGQEFTITAGEPDWYVRRAWDIPKRCKKCRDAANARIEQKFGKRREGV